MIKTESRWRRRQRGYHALVVGGGLFGALLILGSLAPGDLSWIFGLLALASLIAGCRQTLKLWNVDSSPHSNSLSFEIPSNSFRTSSLAARDS